MSDGVVVAGSDRVGRFALAGVPLAAHVVTSAAHGIIDLAARGCGARVHLCNAHVLSLAATDPEYAELLAGSDLNLPDGLPVAFAARRTGIPSATRVPGADLFTATVRKGVEADLGHYLYGSTPEVLDHLVEGLHSSEPRVRIVAAESPPFRDLTDDEFEALCDRIRDSGAHIVWVGLGTPKQDRLMARLREHVDVVTVAVGAAFDFLAGEKQRAPGWMQKLGLEWVHRLLSEPGRLWRRYLVGNLLFLTRVWPTRRLLAAGDPPPEEPRAPTRPSVRIRQTLIVADALVIAASSYLAYFARQALGEVGRLGPFQNELPIAVAVLPLWLFVLYSFGCYRPEFQNQSSEAFRRFLAATTVAGLVLGFVSFAFRLDLSRLYVAVAVGSTLVLGTLARSVLRGRLRRMRSQGRLTRRVLVVGADEEARKVAHAMLSYPVAGYEVLGFVAEEVEEGFDDGLPVLGRPQQILELATELDVELVVLSPGAVPPGTLRDITIALEDSDVDIAVAPSLFEVVTRRVIVESVANVPVLHVDQIRLEGWKAAVKRLFDLIVVVVLGVLTLPLVIAAAVAIKLDDGGPILFRQRRVGRDGGLFRLYKFRTMVPDAESQLVHVSDLNEAGQHFFKIREDPRVTRVGRFLRKWSIDELPQLWNVIRGDMSMVGPRPPLPSEVVRYEPWHRRRLRIKPGITGVWQVSGRSDVPFDEAVRLDLFYIENWSLAYDVYLLAKTVPAVLGRSGAY